MTSFLPKASKVHDNNLYAMAWIEVDGTLVD
jgi:hypothetical protein